jgi:hypothetical protein
MLEATQVHELSTNTFLKEKFKWESKMCFVLHNLIQNWNRFHVYNIFMSQSIL